MSPSLFCLCHPHLLLPPLHLTTQLKEQTNKLKSLNTINSFIDQLKVSTINSHQKRQLSSNMKVLYGSVWFCIELTGFCWSPQSERVGLPVGELSPSQSLSLPHVLPLGGQGRPSRPVQTPPPVRLCVGGGDRRSVDDGSGWRHEVVL